MEKNRTSILAFYAALSAVVIFCSLPNFQLQNIGYTLVTVALLLAYIARAYWPKGESFEENHTTFIIRTIWVYSLFVFFGILGAGMMIGQNGNPDALTPMLDAMVSGVQPAEADLEIWMRQYYTDNESLILNQSRIWLCPAQIYLVWRILQGGGRAFKGYRLARPKSWF